MDAVIGRTEYRSGLGAFAKGLRGSQLPRKHEVFFDLVKALDIRGYVTGRGRSRDTLAAFDNVVQEFAGAEGFLGVHKGKVVDYLGVGTVLGRNQSTAHDQTYIADSSWTTMAGRLADAIGEREARSVSGCARRSPALTRSPR